MSKKLKIKCEYCGKEIKKEDTCFFATIGDERTGKFCSYEHLIHKIDEKTIFNYPKEDVIDFWIIGDLAYIKLKEDERRIQNIWKDKEYLLSSDCFSDLSEQAFNAVWKERNQVSKELREKQLKPIIDEIIINLVELDKDQASMKVYRDMELINISLLKLKIKIRKEKEIWAKKEL